MSLLKLVQITKYITKTRNKYNLLSGRYAEDSTEVQVATEVQVEILRNLWGPKGGAVGSPKVGCC